MVSTQSLNRQILIKLLIAAVMMFGFGYALVPMYKALCEVTGINVVTNKNDYGIRAFSPNKVGNTQVNYARTVTIEFDSNSRVRNSNMFFQINNNSYLKYKINPIDLEIRKLIVQAMSKKIA
mgnify:CR=1 FL=1